MVIQVVAKYYYNPLYADKLIITNQTKLFQSKPDSINIKIHHFDNQGKIMKPQPVVQSINGHKTPEINQHFERIMEQSPSTVSIDVEVNFVKSLIKQLTKQVYVDGEVHIHVPGAEASMCCDVHQIIQDYYQELKTDDQYREALNKHKIFKKLKELVDEINQYNDTFSGEQLKKRYVDGDKYFCE